MIEKSVLRKRSSAHLERTRSDNVEIKNFVKWQTEGCVQIANARVAEADKEGSETAEPRCSSKNRRHACVEES